jgi:ribose transport system ATP-binding protein
LVNADFECHCGEVHALIGENGAGKSTLVKILCGVVQADAGTVILNGNEIKVNIPTEATDLGIAAVFQELSLVPELSVVENIYLGCEPTHFLGQINSKKMNVETRRIMHELGFDIDVRTLVKDLNFAQQQLVEIAKALSKNPDIVIMDEATSALGSKDAKVLFQIIRRLVERDNKAVIFISHRMNELSEVADVATVYRDARYVGSFKWGAKTHNEIISMVAGRAIESAFPPKKERLPDEVALKVEGVTYKDKLKNISFDVRKGEIFGLGGLTGHGQTDLLDVLFGAVRPDRGKIELNGQLLTLRSPRKAIRNRIALTPADRKKDGLLLERPVRDNLALMTLSRRSHFGVINKKAENLAIRRMTELLQIKVAYPEQLAMYLSGGNQQKVVIGKSLLTEADVLLLSDPTRGIDVGTKHEIYPLIRKLSEEGITVILYSTENSELLGLCDRVAVLKQGELAAMLEGDTLTEHEILRAALGFDSRDKVSGDE